MEFDDLDPDKPGFNGFELIRVMVTNHAGVKELTKMPRAHWAYLVWLEKMRLLDIDAFLQHNSKRFSDLGLGKTLQYCIAELAYNRDRAGLPNPKWFGAVEALEKEWHEGIKDRLPPMF